jgi:transcriptional regulator with XRE-family HTH domain
VLYALLYGHTMTERALRPDPTLQLLGTTIRQYRQAQGLSQLVLAARMGLHDSYLSKIELGRHNITVLTLFRLAHALDVPASSLLAPLDTNTSFASPLICESVDSGETLDAVMTHDIASSPQPSDPVVLLQVLGETIHHYRRQQGLSQRALATRTGLSATYITEIEQGHRNLSILNLVRLAESLNIPISSLLML